MKKILLRWEKADYASPALCAPFQTAVLERAAGDNQEENIWEKFGQSVSCLLYTSTLLIAVLAAPIGGILSMVVAFLVVRKRFVGRRLVEYVSMLGMAVPRCV